MALMRMLLLDVEMAMTAVAFSPYMQDLILNDAMTEVSKAAYKASEESVIA